MLLFSILLSVVLTNCQQFPTNQCPCDVNEASFDCTGPFYYDRNCGDWQNSAGVSNECQCTWGVTWSTGAPQFPQMSPVCIQHKLDACDDYVNYPFCNADFTCPQPNQHCIFNHCCDCHGEPQKPRCAPCCETTEPPIPTPQPSPPTPEPTRPTPQPTRKTVSPTPSPETTTPPPVPTPPPNQCPCDDPKQCMAPFFFNSLCGNYVDPIYGDGVCDCARGLAPGPTGGDPDNVQVCIRRADPNDPNVCSDFTRYPLCQPDGGCADPGYYCIPNNCCEEPRCAPCCDTDYPPPGDDCNCEDPGQCTPNLPFWFYKQCGTWQEPTTGEAGVCQCMRDPEAFNNKGEQPQEPICFRYYDFSDPQQICNDFRYPTCDAANPCPDNHWCTRNHCCQDGKERCVPCCDEPFIEG